MPASLVTNGRPVPALSSATIPSSSAIVAPLLRLLVGVEAGGEGMPVDLAEVLESVEPFEYLLYPDVHARLSSVVGATMEGSSLLRIR